MSDERCPRCDRAIAAPGSEAWYPVREAFVRLLGDDEVRKAMDPTLCFGQDDCHKRAVDWRARALAAEEKFGNPLMVICAICGFTGLAANHHHTCPSPPPEVLRAAERIGELASRATKGPWTDDFDGIGPDVVTLGDDGGCSDPECRGGPSYHVEISPDDRAFIAECRTLAVVLAEWVKGGGR